MRWTEDSEAHVARHDVDPAEVEQAVFGRQRLVDSGRGGTRVVFGTTDADRYLVAVLSDAEDGRLFVVTARDMTGSERRAFGRRAQ